MATDPANQMMSWRDITTLRLEKSCVQKQSLINQDGHIISWIFDCRDQNKTKNFSSIQKKIS